MIINFSPLRFSLHSLFNDPFSLAPFRDLSAPSIILVVLNPSLLSILGREAISLGFIAVGTLSPKAVSIPPGLSLCNI